jgi:hypothetical protein
MTKPMVRIHNIKTDEIIDREMTDAEFAQYNQDKTNREAKEAETQAKATAKAALLTQLGITEEQAKLLLS